MGRDFRNGDAAVIGNVRIVTAVMPANANNMHSLGVATEVGLCCNVAQYGDDSMTWQVTLKRGRYMHFKVGGRRGWVKLCK